MTSRILTRPTLYLRRVFTLAALLPLTACGEILAVEDRDIIDPVDVRSPAGADAVRVGALARLNAATSGSESLFLLGGLFADEFRSGDTFIDRQQVDQRSVTARNAFLVTANRNLHRARLSAQQAVELMTQYRPDAPGWQRAEMHFIQAYTMNLAAEHYCNGLTFSTVANGIVEFGKPITTQAAFELALEQANTGLALITGTTANDLRVRRALQVTKGRILLNLNRPAEAAAAVADVPTNFRYEMFHAETTTRNNIWNWNNSARRYTVSNLEGGNGINFVTANDPRVPTCRGGDPTCRAIGVTNANTEDTSAPLFAQRIWPTRESPVAIVDGIGARMIEAEAQLRANNFSEALRLMNVARATVSGLQPLTDPGTAAARIDLLFRERAFWFFARGQRVGDLRRLVRQYGRQPNTVFPTGSWHKGGEYGADVNIPLPLEEANNPNIGTEANLCLDRNA